MPIAHAAALERLSRSATDPRQRAELTVARELVLARATPVVVPAATLASYAGDYVGGGLITFAHGVLVHQLRHDQPRAPLVPLSVTKFLVRGARLEFVTELGRRRMRVTQPSEPQVTYNRVGAAPQ